MLAGSRIPRIARAETRRRVAIPNSSEAEYVIDERGEAWIRKLVSSTGHTSLQAEAIWWQLAKLLEIPTPDAAVYVGPPEEGWLSRLVEPIVHWDPALLTRITNLPELGAILTLDAVTANSDRHPENILLQLTDNGEFRLWAIDAGDAAIGVAQDLSALDERPPTPHRATRGIHIDLVRAHALETAVRLQTLEASALRAIIVEGCSLGRSPDTVDQLHDALLRRCRSASAITEAYLEAISRLT